MSANQTTYNKTALLCAFFFGCAVTFCVGHFFDLHGRSGIQPQSIRIIDSVEIPVPVPVPGETVYVAVPIDVDTAAILREYYTKNIYEDTLLMDDKITLVLRDTVFNNRLTGRTLFYDYKFQNIIQANNEIMLNAYLSKNMQAFMAGYKKKRWVYYGGYDFYNRTPMVGVGYTLFKW